jgi:hypothetical protein
LPIAFNLVVMLVQIVVTAVKDVIIVAIPAIVAPIVARTVVHRVIIALVVIVIVLVVLVQLKLLSKNKDLPCSILFETPY